MSFNTDLKMAYHMGYDDALARRRPDVSKVHVFERDTCTADETERIYFSWQDGRHLTIHVMECSECGHTYEHVNGDYEYCPRCGRRRRDV